MVRILAVADSDSYLKWAAGLLDALPASWERRLVVVRTPIVPTDTQMDAALSGTGHAGRRLHVLTARALRRLVETLRPDVLLLACTGPVVDLLTHVTLDPPGWGPRRPVLVSGLPGILVPASARAWGYRSSVDLFVVHSHRELREYTRLGHALGMAGQVALARLPSLTGGAASGAGGRPCRDRVVFAGQARVPPSRADRERILRSLAALAENRRDLRVVVKLRSEPDEMQTHHEHLHYQQLWHAMVAAGRVPAGAVQFEQGPVRDHLWYAAGLVTAGSTAALEAIAMDVPLLVLSDFGVSGALHNIVFEGSGCLGTLHDLEKADFRAPDPDWCARNYFHDTGQATWQTMLGRLVAASRTGVLPSVPAEPVHRYRRGRLRMAVPPTLYRRAVHVSRHISPHVPRRRRAPRDRSPT